MENQKQNLQQQPNHQPNSSNQSMTQIAAQQPQVQQTVLLNTNTQRQPINSTPAPAQTPIEQTQTVANVDQNQNSEINVEQEISEEYNKDVKNALIRENLKYLGAIFIISILIYIITRVVL